MAAGSQGHFKIGAQLYSVNAELAAHPDATLAAPANIGYRTVESANAPRDLNRRCWRNCGPAKCTW